MKPQYAEEMPLVSCIVTCFNKVAYLYEAIASVLSQDYPALELLVADDGTADFPSAEIKAYIQDHKKDNLQNAVVLHQEKNVGTVRNINSALSIAAGNYLINLDGDDVFYSNTVIREMIKTMLERDLDLLECSKMRCDEHLNELERLPTPKQKEQLKKLNTAQKQYHSFAVFRFYNIGGGSGVAYTKDCVQKLGLFDESFRNWQDGPTLIAYVQKGRTIPTNFDIVAVRYRAGGVSNAPGKNKGAFSHISRDRALYTEMYTIPDVFNPHVFLRRRRVFWYRWDHSSSFHQRVWLMIRYPDQGLPMLLRKLRRRPTR